MLKRSVVCAALLGVVGIGLASSGGGKKKTAIPAPVFTPLRSTGTFTLRFRSDYAGSEGFIRPIDQKSILYRSVVAYQRGNTIYVLPSSYRINTAKPGFHSNLSVLDLKIRLNR